MTSGTILSDMIRAARAAGELLLTLRTHEYRLAQTEDFPVIDADKKAQDVIFAALSQHTECGFLSEEKKDDQTYRSRDCFFIIDPLDGTKDFVEHTEDFCVMIAYAERGIITIGVVYEPVNGRLTWAERGRGAWQETTLGAQSIAISAESMPERMTLLTSRFHEQPYEQRLQDALGIGTRVQCGSAGVKMTAVADGRAHVYVNISAETGEWDTAAGSIIVQEAGGVVTDLDGQPLQYGQPRPYNTRGFVVSNGAKHEAIIAALRSILSVDTGKETGYT